jgi:hypothetical protein
MNTKLKAVSARFFPEERELIKKVCKLRGEDLSSFLRRAVKRELIRLGFSTPEERKALEMVLEKEK